MEIKGKKAAVFGDKSGMGRATAGLPAAGGSDVAVLDRPDSGGDAKSGPHGSLPLMCAAASNAKLALAIVDSPMPDDQGLRLAGRRMGPK